MMGMISLVIGGVLLLGTVLIVLASFRERPSVKAKLKLETTRIVFPVRAELNELETKVHRQVREIQEIAGSPPPVAACAPPPSPLAAAEPKSEHDTRMIRMVTEKAETIQRLAEESSRNALE